MSFYKLLPGLAALLLAVSGAVADPYYVDNTIVDVRPASGSPDCASYDPSTHACTGGSARAYASVADLNAASFVAGDCILFRKGQTWREQLTVAASGSAGSPVVFGAFGAGADPIISGADLLVAEWMPVDRMASVYKAKLVIQPTRVFRGSTELTKSRGQPVVPGSNQWGWSEQEFFINLGRSPVGQTIEVTQRDAAVRDATGEDYVTIQDLHLRCNNAERGGVIKLNIGSEHWAILRTTIEGGAGSGFDGETSCGNDLTFSHNTVRSNNQWGVAAGQRAKSAHVYSHNIVHDNGKSGFLVTVRNSTFSHNTVFHNGFATKHPSHGFYFYNYQGGGDGNTLECNEVYGHDSAVDGDTGLRLSGSGNIVRNNRFHDNYYAMSIIDAEQDNRHNTICGNAIYRTKHKILEIDGAQNLIISNNYLDCELQFNRGERQKCARNTVTHNVFDAPEGTYITVAAGQAEGFASDRNCFCPITGGSFSWQGAVCDFVGWQSRSGQDLHSWRSASRFVDPGAPELIDFLKSMH